ncbi:cellulose synthase operon protein YhjQ/BcsQ [Vibrio sp. 99-70-13A1]|uniref:cellulose synthase operon protein YhjQ/BcsQ n=1 Tax=Vibrio sp. 99-70-13A1 TaxID=2607601 RepID=UPI001493A16C|nr:cellulose synthase operon protein YhjQ/BcsQ [Vibrio sp. 99-70-13A1]NOH98106.1 AAA family ATPase [Vibrio sp. 99-70-13A1]
MSVIIIQSLLGGSGATTVTSGLASSLALLGKKVVVVDLDSRNLVGFGLGVDLTKQKGWSDYPTNNKGWMESIYQNASGACCIPYGGTNIDFDVVLRHFENMIPMLETKFDLIIALFPVRKPVSHLHIPVVLNLMVVTPTVNTVVKIKRQMDTFSSDESLKLVVNQCNPNNQLTHGILLLLETLLPNRLLSVKLRSDAAIQDSLSQLTNVVEQHQYSESHACKEFNQLAIVTLSLLERFAAKVEPA